MYNQGTGETAVPSSAKGFSEQAQARACCSWWLSVISTWEPKLKLLICLLSKVWPEAAGGAQVVREELFQGNCISGYCNQETGLQLTQDKIWEAAGSTVQNQPAAVLPLRRQSVFPLLLLIKKRLQKTSSSCLKSVGYPRLVPQPTALEISICSYQYMERERSFWNLKTSLEWSESK